MAWLWRHPGAGKQRHCTINIAIRLVLKGIKRNVEKILYTAWWVHRFSSYSFNENGNAFPSGSHPMLTFPITLTLTLTQVMLCSTCWVAVFYNRSDWWTVALLWKPSLFIPFWACDWWGGAGTIQYSHPLCAAIGEVCRGEKVSCFVHFSHNNICNSHVTNMCNLQPIRVCSCLQLLICIYSCFKEWAG